MRPLIRAALVVAATTAAFADEPLVTDRPDFTESAVSVEPGRFQLEFGATGAEGGEEREFSAGEVLFRAGVVDRLELRLEIGSFAWSEVSGGEDPSGLTTASVGLKVELVRSSSRVLGGMQMALLAGVTVPIGDSDVGTDAWLPSAVLAAGWDLTDRVSVGTNLGLASLDEGTKRFTAAWLTGAVGLAISDRWGAFFELFGFTSERDRGPSTGTFQTGVTFLVSSDFQLDARIARRVTAEGPDVLIGIGGAWRFGGGG